MQLLRPGADHPARICAAPSIAAEVRCKVLDLDGLLTHHVSHAHARYRCHTAAHMASTLEVYADHIQYWSLGLVQRSTLQLVSGVS